MNSVLRIQCHACVGITCIWETSFHIKVAKCNNPAHRLTPRTSQNEKKVHISCHIVSLCILQLVYLYTFRLGMKSTFGKLFNYIPFSTCLVLRTSDRFQNTLDFDWTMKLIPVNTVTSNCLKQQWIFRSTDPFEMISKV